MEKIRKKIAEIRQVEFGTFLFNLSEKFRNLSETITPTLAYMTVSPKKPDSAFHGWDVKFIPERHNFELLKDIYRVSPDGYHLTDMDKRLVRDILWAFNHRNLIRSGIDEFSDIDRKLFYERKTEMAIPRFERPYQDTVKVGAIYSGGLGKSDWIEYYIASSSEDELLDAYTKKLEGKLFLIEQHDKK
ncbi:MAG: hypothetical protein AABX11_07565 [Nanoarchaeota archaeon]